MLGRRHDQFQGHLLQAAGGVVGTIPAKPKVAAQSLAAVRRGSISPAMWDAGNLTVVVVTGIEIIGRAVAILNVSSVHVRRQPDDRWYR